LLIPNRFIKPKNFFLFRWAEELLIRYKNPDFPSGYTISTVKKHELRKQVAAVHAAFESSKEIEAYTEHYR
jgi:hypothetical protein